MPRDGATILSDLIGKLNAVRVRCERCGRNGHYRLERLIADRGSNAKIVDLLHELIASYEIKQAQNWGTVAPLAARICQGSCKLRFDLCLPILRRQSKRQVIKARSALDALTPPGWEQVSVSVAAVLAPAGLRRGIVGRQPPPSAWRRSKYRNSVLRYDTMGLHRNERGCHE
jgi:hypothetical protein